MTSPINAALMRLATRAETNDPATLVATFVDAGPLFTLLSSANHQILYGRRGTGKTHALYYLGEHVRKTGDQTVYLDLRQLGSTGGLYADGSLTIQERATRLLVDALLGLSQGIYSEILHLEPGMPDILEPALSALEDVSEAITQVRVTGPVTRELQATNQRQDVASGSLSVTLSQAPSFQLVDKNDATHSVATSTKRTESGNEQHVVHFGSVAQALTRLLDTLPGKKFWLLMDEWSVLPLELQPLLADFIRRCLLPIKGLVVKIAAIEQRSRFRVQDAGGDYLGIELGADMSADLDFDDFMVFNNDAEKAKNFFAELFFRHVRQMSYDDAADGGGSNGLVRSSADFQSRAFTQRNAFEELVRSAEGVPRDAIYIASLAAQRAVNDPISVPQVRVAARKWYQRDKESAVQATPEALRLLHWIHEEVIGKRRARACLVRQDAGRSDPLIRVLFDARVLHVIKRGVSGGDVPGVRFDVYALDYGCYVELMTTKISPLGLLSYDDDLAADVPADDYRAIRRAILDLEDFARSAAVV
jgi:hypothetical protein